MRRFKTRSPGSHDQAGPLRIAQGSIGRGAAGKTVLLRTARRRTLQRKLPSGLVFDVDDPRKTADLMNEARATTELLELRGVPPTSETPELAIELYAQERKLAVLQSREAVGQVFTHTTTSSPAEQQERFRQHVEHLSQASVLWVVLSVPPAGSSPQDLARYEEDLLTAGSYLRESLRLRRPERTCGVAVVITKLDTLFESADEARRRWTDEEVITRVGPLASQLEDSDKVSWAIIHPLSAFGFGVAEQLEASGGDDRLGGGGEPTWVLRPGAVLKPYNILPLIVWSFLAGMLNQEVAPEEAADLAGVCRLLHDDLEALGGWQITLRGGL